MHKIKIKKTKGKLKKVYEYKKSLEIWNEKINKY